MIADYINGHQAEFWILLGFILLVLEVVTGLTTGIFLFAGLGALVSGLLMQTGLLAETWTAGIASVGISSGVIAAILWRPLQRLQGGRTGEKDNSSDLVGYEFVIEQDVTTLAPGKIRYSGVDWRVELHKDAGVDSITAGQRVAVASVDVGVFRVKPV